MPDRRSVIRAKTRRLGGGYGPYLDTGFKVASRSWPRFVRVLVLGTLLLLVIAVVSKAIGADSNPNSALRPPQPSPWLQSQTMKPAWEGA